MNMNIPSCAIMNCNIRGRECHPERSEGSGTMDTEILRCAQDDITYGACGNSLSRTYAYPTVSHS
jgi:hypothetical protein